MTDDDRIDELLAQWEDRFNRGDDVSAESLCADHPHLAERLAEAIRELQATAWMNRLTPPAATPTDAGARRASLWPRLLKGRYRLERRIGSGGYGEVWLGFDRDLERHVAVKCSLGHDSNTEESNKLLRDEAKRVAKLRHTGILPIHDFGEDESGYFFVADYLPGGTLADRVARSRPSVAEAVGMARQVAAALAHAHRLGVVHRDLKPSNVLIDENGYLCLADFGIALTLPRKSANAPQRGTPAYMSPEQFAGEARLDARSDVYGLGVLLYELLTGETPFAANTIVELREQVLRRTPRLASELNPLVPTTLAHIVARCLEKKPRDRFANAGEVDDALGRLAINGVATAPATTGQRRNRSSRDEGHVDDVGNALSVPDLSLPLLTKRRRRSRSDTSGTLGCLQLALAGVGGVMAIAFMVYYAAGTAEDVPYKAGQVPAGQNPWDHLAVWAVVAILSLIVGLLALRRRAAESLDPWEKSYFDASGQPTRSHRRSRLFRDEY